MQCMGGVAVNMADISSSQSIWSALSMAPMDITFGLSELCKADPNPNKVNMAIGVFSDDEGNPYVLPIVRKVEGILVNKKLDKEYAGILGNKIFRKVATELVIGTDCNTSPHIATAQTVGGTASLRVIAEFLFKHYPYNKTVYLSEQTWPNHPTIFKEAGLSLGCRYRYFDPITSGLDTKGLYEDLMALPDHSIIVFQACGHNPTGVDPSNEQWTEISRMCKEKGHFVIFDVTYLGFASGSIDEDAFGVRKVISDGNSVAFCQSFSKNMGLYGERAGSIGITCTSSVEKDIVESHISKVIRPLYSNPPIHGGRIVTEILTNTLYRAEWTQELKDLFDKVYKKRELFYQSLISNGTTHDWSFVMSQKGWFCFTGINKDQAERLQKQYGIYMNTNGRVPLVALSIRDINYSAKAFNAITN